MIPVLFLAGFALRFFMWLSQKSPWGDEWFTIDLVQKSAMEVFKGSVQDVHPFLYNLLLHGWIRIFGTAEASFRFFSLMPSVGVLVVVYLLAKELFGKKEAAFALFMVAVSPYWLQSSNEIRSYSWLAFASILSVFFFVRAVRTGAVRWRLAWSVTALVSLYIEHYAWFVFLATGLFTLWAQPRDAKRSSLLKSHALIFLCGLPLLGIIAHQALFREEVFKAGRMAEYHSLAVLAKKMAGVFWHFSSGYSFSMVTVEQIAHFLKTSAFFWLSGLNMIFCLAFLAKGFHDMTAKRQEFLALLAMILLAPILLLGTLYPIRLDARYLSFAAPLFFLMVARGLACSAKRLYPVLFLAVFTPVALHGSWQSITSRTDPVHKEDYKALMEHVFQSAGTQDAVCGLEGQVKYYRERLKLNPQTPSFADINQLSAEEAARFRKIWVVALVNMHEAVTDHGYREDIRKMERLGFIPFKEPTPVGGEESLTAYYVFENPRHPSGAL